MDRSEPCGTGVWPLRHRATPITGSRWWHRWNRWPDTGNTNGPALEYRSHRPARICWSAGDDGAAAVPVGDRNVEPSARSSCDRPPDRARRTTLRHRGATASTEDTSAAHRISSGAVCRHLKIAGRVAFFTISSDYQPPPPKLQHIRWSELNSNSQATL